MATATLRQLMEAVEARAETIGLRSSAYSPGMINPPTLIVGVPPVPSYRAAFGRGTVELRGWPLTILVSAKLDRIGQLALADYLSWSGPLSIPKALEDEPTLGGVVSDLMVESSRPLGLDEVGVLGYFGGELRLSVNLPGI